MASNLQGSLRLDLDNESKSNEYSSAARYTLLVALLCSLCNILLGYDIGIMSVAHDFIRDDLLLTRVQDGFQVGILNAAGGVGALLTGELADRYGRRGTMCFAAALFFIGSFAVTVAQGFAAVVVGRIITGMGCGIGAICSPLLLSELTPPSKRGMLCGWTEVVNNVGICLGFVVGYALSGMPTHVGWRIMIGMGCLPPLAIWAATFVVPESPRWLIMHGRVEDAQAVVRLVSEPEERADVMKNCMEALSTEVAPWSEVLCPGRALRMLAVVGWGVPFLSQATGTESAVYFSPNILAQAGIVNEYAMNIAVGAVKASLLVIPMMTMDYFGRRPVLMISVAGQALSAFALAQCLLLGSDSSYYTVFALFLYIGTFSLGLSTVPFVIPPEVFPLKYRARATGVSSFLNRITSSIVAMTFLPASDLIGASGVFFFYSCVACVGLVYVYLYVPETGNRSLEECQALFDSNNYT